MEGFKRQTFFLSHFFQISFCWGRITICQHNTHPSVSPHIRPFQKLLVLRRRPLAVRGVLVRGDIPFHCGFSCKVKKEADDCLNACSHSKSARSWIHHSILLYISTAWRYRRVQPGINIKKMLREGEWVVSRMKHPITQFAHVQVGAIHESPDVTLSR